MERPVEFQGPGGVRLRGVLHVPENENGTAVILCHGLLANCDGPKHRAWAELLSGRGHAVLRFDFAGRGRSEGSSRDITLSGQVEQCRRAVEFVRHQGANRVGLVGSSFGGTTALCFAARHGADVLATVAAPARLDRLGATIAGPAGLDGWREKGVVELEGNLLGYGLVEDAAGYDPLALAGRIACPWLIVHGKRDEVVCVEDAMLLAERSPASRLELMDADHAFTDQVMLGRMVEMVADFVDRELKMAGTRREAD